MIAIVVSRADSASAHIGERLLDRAEWEERTDEELSDAEGGGTYFRRPGLELREFDEIHVELDDPATAFVGDADDSAANPRAGDPADRLDCLAFVSRHSGETGPLLTAHFTGNFGEAKYGGEPDALSETAPGAAKRVVEHFTEHAPEGYDAAVECTHHGPTNVSVPSLFVELGSAEPQWTDAKAAGVVADAVIGLASTGPDLVGEDGCPRHVVGFGGGHYAPRFSRIVAETDWAVGHIGSEWNLAAMGAPDANRDLLDRAFEASRARHAVVDGTHPELVETLTDLGYRVVSETWVREVGRTPLALVSVVEDAVGRIDAGLRFGKVRPAVDYAGDDASDDAPERVREALEVLPLPADLLAAAQGVDADGARDAIEETTVAFDTEHSGSRAGGDAAFAVDDALPGYTDLVNGLADVLADGYDEVTVEPDAVVAVEEAFEPSLAAKVGVPEGPEFGKLAAGEAVEVGDRTIPPEAVRREQETRFPVERSPAGDATGE
ncbi:D-aminoacyl-tRNA deacylase [Halorubrum gandharaense]